MSCVFLFRLVACLTIYVCVCVCVFFVVFFFLFVKIVVKVYPISLFVRFVRSHSFAIMPVKRHNFLHLCLIIINIVVCVCFFSPFLVLRLTRCNCVCARALVHFFAVSIDIYLSIYFFHFFDYKRILCTVFVLFFHILSIQYRLI